MDVIAPDAEGRRTNHIYGARDAVGEAALLLALAWSPTKAEAAFAQAALLLKEPTIWPKTDGKAAGSPIEISISTMVRPRRPTEVHFANIPLPFVRRAAGSEYPRDALRPDTALRPRRAGRVKSAKRRRSRAQSVADWRARRGATF